MQLSQKIFFTLAIICLISTAYGKQKTAKDKVVEGATHIKDTVADKVTDGVKTGAKLATDGAKVAADAAKTAG